MRSNTLLTFAVIGLLIGALAGYLTRPVASEVKIGPVSIEVQGGSAARDNGPLTSGQMQHIALIALIGVAIGFGVGFATRGRA